MDIFVDPNVSYLLLVLGIILAALALVSPGTGMLEIGALFLIVIAGYGAYNLGVNLWALIVLTLAVAVYVYAIRAKRREISLALSILGLVGGSLFLYSDGWKPLVNPVLASIVSLISAGSLWLMINKTLQAHQLKPSHDLGLLVGQTGEAKTRIQEEGSVQGAGELWTARSEKPIPAGAHVRVVGREGFVLFVEVDEAAHGE